MRTRLNVTLYVHSTSLRNLLRPPSYVHIFSSALYRVTVIPEMARLAAGYEAILRRGGIAPLFVTSEMTGQLHTVATLPPEKAPPNTH
jgi:hypothetical protein